VNLLIAFLNVWINFWTWGYWISYCDEDDDYDFIIQTSDIMPTELLNEFF